MIAALLLLTVAAADAVIGLFELAVPSRRAEQSSGRIERLDIAASILGGSTAAVVAAVGWLVVGVPPAVAAAMLLLALGWICAGQVFAVTGRTAPILVTAVVLIAATAFSALVGRGSPVDAASPSPFSQWMASLGVAVSPAFIVGVIAVALALTRTSNLICRAALGRTMPADAPSGSVQPRHRWFLAIGSRRIATVTETAAVSSEPPAVGDGSAHPAGLKGGRVIGPLERILIVALGVVGSQALIVGLLAAKGIVRFPEISADNRHGSKAEEFLVGSLVSWTLAGLGVALLVALLNS